MQIIRKVGGGYFIGFRNTSPGKAEPQWAIPQSSQAGTSTMMAMTFSPAVPQDVIEGLNKSGVPYTVLTFST